MKKLLILTGAVFISAALSLSAYSQNTSEIDWLSGIDKKGIASYGDAVTFFIMQTGKTSSTFEKNQETLNTEGLALSGYSQDSRLTKGMLSKMTAKYLNLSGSFMYLIFKTERYAYKACVADSIFTEDGSSNDLVSGPGMIEVFSKISEMKEGAK